MGLSQPLAGVHVVTQPFGGSYVGEPSGWLQMNAGKTWRGKQSFFLGGWWKAHMHKGLDVACAVGTPVHAPQAGRIVQLLIEPDAGHGHDLYLEIRPGTVLTFAHLSAFQVTVGQHVTQGQVVALSGATGHATGPHLHWEVRHSTSQTDHRTSYGWLRYNPARCLNGGDLAYYPWLAPL